jgi:hypothetical protein
MSAIAQGKENAANIKVGDRILVKHYTQENEADRATLEWLGKDRALGISRTKTGEGVTVARVLAVEAVMVQGRRAQRRYNIITTEGVLENNAPIQTMIMAPEDAAGIKRAHAEALELDKVYEAYPVAEAETEAPAVDAAHTPDHSSVFQAVRLISANVAPAAAPLATLAEAAQGLGRTLRPILEDGVRQARDIPEGRRRHGQTKARRDALRHARKLELANL